MLYYTFTFYIEHLCNFQHKGYHSLLITTITINQTLHVPTLIHKHPHLPRVIALGPKTIPVMSRPIHASTSPPSLPNNRIYTTSRIIPHPSLPPYNPNKLNLQTISTSKAILAPTADSVLIARNKPVRSIARSSSIRCLSALSTNKIKILADPRSLRKYSLAAMYELLRRTHLCRDYHHYKVWRQSATEHLGIGAD